MSEWYLRKPDGSNYGPISTADLRRWAAECRLVAGNEVSSDKENWLQVEDLPELKMEWVAKRPDGKEYGPFNIAATKDLHKHGVLPEDAELTNRTSGKTCLVSAVLNEKDDLLKAKPESAGEVEEKNEPKSQKPNDTRKKTKNKSEDSQKSNESESDTSSLVQLEDEFKEYKKKNRSQIKLLTEERDTLSENLATLQKSSDNAIKKEKERNIALKANLTEMESQIANSRQELARLRMRTQKAETAVAETESAAVEDVSDLRKQLAFMKKNTATLTADLDTAQVKVSRTTRILFLLILANVTIAVIFSLLKRDDTFPGNSELSDTVAIPSQLDSEIQQPDENIIPAKKEEYESTTSLRSWPEIDVDGVRVISDNNSCTMVFEQGFFASMTRPSEWGRDRLAAVTEQIGPHVSHFNLLITGHTDNQPLRNSKQYSGNDALALARAKAVAKLLATEYAFPTDLLKITTGGNNSAPFPNDTIANKKRNRTVVLKLMRN